MGGFDSPYFLFPKERELAGMANVCSGTICQELKI